jgi:hypothetical protein
MGKARCRFSGQPSHHTFVDLGMSPLANSYLRAEQLNQAEKFYPLHTYIAEDTLLVQILPWNLKEEIMEQMAFIGEWGGQCVVPIPEVQVFAAKTLALV